MKGERIFSVFWFLLSLLFFITSFFLIPIEELSVSSPAGYPIFISVICLVLSCFSMAKRSEISEETREKKVLEPVVLHMIFLLVLYVIAIVTIHFILATLLFLFTALCYLRKGNKRNALMISYISTFLIVFVFKYLFSVIMP